MLGKKCPTGVGGRDCACCGQAPGIERKRARRTVKRSERQAARRERERAAFERLLELEGDEV